ncbi:MAG: hypothetical protein N3D11_14715, partial [Candidatus Sumerlaeia bacterium]|nr:hypothetical protein [Candidatus Sumerlaeia bacterium]
HSPGFHRDYPRLQILSIADLLADPQPWCPRCLKIPAGEDLTFQRPPEYRDTNPREGEMDLLEPVPSYEAGQESGAQ